MSARLLIFVAIGIVVVALSPVLATSMVSWPEPPWMVRLSALVLASVTRTSTTKLHTAGTTLCALFSV